MSDAYNRVSKPTGGSYTNVTGPGKYTFDDPSVLYDSANVAFDGGDGNSYINVSKPTGSPYTKVPKPIS